MTREYVTRPYRQRTTVVTTIPRRVVERLKLERGDHVIWQVEKGSPFVQISKLYIRGSENGNDKRNSDRKYQGG